MASSQPTGHGHVPVMLDRITELLKPAVSAVDSPIIVDCTLGAGGHSEHFLRQFPTARVIGVDRDAWALDYARTRLAPFGDRFTGVHSRFDEFLIRLRDLDVVDELGDNPGEIAGVLFDLGVSSMQLDQPERGFSYAQDAPLDMRMDQAQSFTAADLVNTYSHGELARVLKDYGDERFAGKIASQIISRREKAPLSRTGELVEAVYAAVPAPARRTGGHPAKRTFQALRVAVNSELESVARGVAAAMDSVTTGGRVVVMSYQSHEDRIVKRLMTEGCASTTPKGLPMELPGTEPEFTSVTRGSEKASGEEISVNPRAKSVRVRAVERTRRRGTSSP